MKRIDDIYLALNFKAAYKLQFLQKYSQLFIQNSFTFLFVLKASLQVLSMNWFNSSICLMKIGNICKTTIQLFRPWGNTLNDISFTYKLLWLCYLFCQKIKRLPSSWKLCEASLNKLNVAYYKVTFVV